MKKITASLCALSAAFIFSAAAFAQEASETPLSYNENIWLTPFYTHSKLKDSSSGKGFKSDAEGFDFGFFHQATENFDFGLSYGFTHIHTQNSLLRQHFYSNSFQARLRYNYKGYKLDTKAGYGFATYKQKFKKNRDSAKTDVNTYDFQIMLSKKLRLLTPEGGLKYLLAKKDGVRTSHGRKISGLTADTLTAVLGGTLEKDYLLDSGLRVSPKVRVVATYDLIREKDAALLTLPNNASYLAEGRRMDRKGLETSFEFIMDKDGFMQFSVGWEGKFRKDFYSHSLFVKGQIDF